MCIRDLAVQHYIYSQNIIARRTILTDLDVWKLRLLIWITKYGVLQYVVQGYFMFPAVRFERQPTCVAPNEERHF